MAVVLVVLAVLILLVLLALLIVRLTRKTSDTYDAGAMEVEAGRNREQEFKDEQSREYIRPTSGQEQMESDPLDPSKQKARMAGLAADRLED
jgi:cell division protein FtsN